MPENSSRVEYRPVSLSLSLFLSLCFYFLKGVWSIGETTPEDATNIGSGSIWTGCLLIVFVNWHTLTLLCGVFLKGTGKQTGCYWCMRICHCGCYCWAFSSILYSFTIWLGIATGGLFPHTLVWFVVTCVILQYLIILYCIVELVIDVHKYFLSLHHSPS